MDWSKVVRGAADVAGPTSQITYQELDILIGTENVSDRDLEELLHALQENGISVVEARVPR